MENGVSRRTSAAEALPRPLAYDTRSAIILAESSIVRWLDAGAEVLLAAGASNAFGEAVTREPADVADAVGRVRRAAARVAAGERVALIASAGELITARAAMVEMAARRLPAVFHAVEEAGVEAAFALADVGWGILFASDVEESFDLAFVARRAAEDSGTPFLVVHEAAPVRRLEPLVVPAGAFVEAFVGPADSRLRGLADPGHPAHARVGARGFAERVPFALASALRELESLTGRKRDTLTRSGPAEGGEAGLMLVAVGALGDVVLGEIPRLRAAGHDVGAVKLTAFRPFPGPRAVRLLARALAVTILEQADAPLAQSNALTREVKAAFADALTWAPEYPGVGRIPRIHSGVSGHAVHDVEAGELEAVVANMLAADQGKRFFTLHHDPLHDLADSSSRAAPGAGSVVHIRGLVRDAASSEVAAELATVAIARILSLRARASIRRLGDDAGKGFAFDLVAGVDRPIGVHLAATIDLIVLDDAAALLEGNPLARLGRSATLAVPTRRASAEAFWGDIPPYAKAIVFDRAARLVGWEAAAEAPAEETIWLTAAAFAGIALATLAASGEGRPAVDPSLVEREIGEIVAERVKTPADLSQRAARCARRAFEASVTVPRAVVERDQEAIHLGRKDARSALA